MLSSWLIIKNTTFVLVFLLILFAYSEVSSSPSLLTVATTPKFNIEAKPAPLSATAYAVFDIKTGELLAAREQEKVLPIASVTKLITAAALLKNTDLSKEGVVTSSDVATFGEAGQLKIGDKYEYRELLFPLLLESSNDAAAFFERETAGKIILDMNELVSSVGMKNTTLVDASGLSESNLSTVSDMVTFLTYLVKEQPHVLDMTRLKQYVGPYGGSLNNSPVLDDVYEGGKHGYTLAANRTMVAIFKEEVGVSERALGYVLLHSDNLAEDTKILRDFVASSVAFE